MNQREATSSATDGQPDTADHVRRRPSGLLALRHPSGRDSSNSCWSAFCSLNTASPENQPSRTADDRVSRNTASRNERLAFRWGTGVVERGASALLKIRHLNNSSQYLLDDAPIFSTGSEPITRLELCQLGCCC